MLKILLADDYPDTTNTLSKVLQAWGHDCEIAYDGPGALKLAADCRPDVALLDIGMPGMDGYAVARQLLTMHPGLPIYAATGYGRLIDVIKSKEAGFTGHLLKPVDLTRLRQILASIEMSLHEPCGV